MAFRTKLDYSDNRQINQRQRTFTNLEGGSVFGVAYSALTSGVGTTCSATTDEYVFTGSTFSGNGTTTMYTWFDPRMEIAAYILSALTSSNSGETQNTGNVFVIDTTATTVDGYAYTLTYTGTSFDLSVDTIYSGAGPVFTGTVTHDFVQFLSACSLDYTGTTMWIDNPEKTRTKRLVITENATPNHVWTCLDTDGNGGWFENSSGGTSGGTSLWTAGTGTDAVVLANSGGIASGQSATAEGLYNIAGGIASHAEGGIGDDLSPAGNQALGISSHAEGFGNIASGWGSHVEGSFNLASGDDGSHAEGIGTKAIGDSSHAEGNSTSATTSSAHSEGKETLASGGSSHAEGYLTTSSGNFGSHAEGQSTVASGFRSHAEGLNTIASGANSHAQGSATLASGNQSHAEGQGTSATTTDAHAEGNTTLAGGIRSHAEGHNTIASGQDSHAQGASTIAGGTSSHAGGSGFNTANQIVSNGNTSFIHFSDITGLNGIGAYGDYSAILGGVDHNIGTGSNNSAIFGGDGNIINNNVINSVILGGDGVTATSSNAAYFVNGVTDMITGYTFSGNTIDMNDGLNSPLTLSHDDQFGGTEFLKLDSTILLQRNSGNYLSVGNGVTFLKSSNQSSVQAINTKLEVKTSFGIFTSTNNPGGDASIHAFKSNASSGSVDSGGLQNGELCAEIVFGGPRNGVFDYDGVMGTGLGVAATGTTGREFMPVFISAPRCQARDTTSYDTIINSVFIGGSDNTMLTGVTDSVIVGGTGHTIDSGVIRTVVLGGIDISATSSDMVYVPDLVIDGLTSTDPLATDVNGKIVAGVSDARLKTNINDLDSPLEKVLSLRGVSYEWTEESNMGAGITKYGLIAQEVQKVIPDMVRLRAKTDDKLTLSYTEIVPWLIEAVKELASDDSPLLNRKELIFKTQTIASEDNNIELNFGGTHSSALNGGITVIKGIDDETNSNFELDSNGDWVTNNYIKPFGLILPRFTPTSTNDKKGKLGEVTRDNSYIYIKRENGWGRCSLEDF